MTTTLSPTADQASTADPEPTIGQSSAHFYDAEGSDKQIAIGDASPDHLTQQQLIWFDVEAEDRATAGHLTGLLNLPADALMLEPDNPLDTMVLFEGKPTFD